MIITFQTSFCNQWVRQKKHSRLAFGRLLWTRALCFLQLVSEVWRNQVLIPQFRLQFLDLIVLVYNLTVFRRPSIFDCYADYCWLPVIMIVALFARLKPKDQDLAKLLSSPASFGLIPLTYPLKQDHRVENSVKWVGGKEQRINLVQDTHLLQVLEVEWSL